MDTHPLTPEDAGIELGSEKFEAQTSTSLANFNSRAVHGYNNRKKESCCSKKHTHIFLYHYQYNPSF